MTTSEDSKEQKLIKSILDAFEEYNTEELEQPIVSWKDGLVTML